MKENIRYLMDKIQWDMTTHPPDWLKWKTWTVPSVDKDVEQLELVYTVGESVNCCSHLRKLFVS